MMSNSLISSLPFRMNFVNVEIVAQRGFLVELISKGSVLQQTLSENNGSLGF